MPKLIPLFLWTVVLLAKPVYGQSSFPPITNSNFAIESHQSYVLGSARITSMGGASAALAEGSAYTIFNPAAAAVRSATSMDNVDWDWHFATLSPSAGSDIDNNGVSDGDARTINPAFSAGLVFQYKTFALGFSAVQDTRDFANDSADRTQLDFILAKSFLNRQLTVGVSLAFPIFSLRFNDQEIFRLQNLSFRTGAVWRPANRSVRLGGAVQIPTGKTSIGTSCASRDCMGFILPGAFETPRQGSIGLAYRFADTPWNMKMRRRWRDEHSFVLAVDLGLIGRTPRGSGIEAFANGLLQPSGRTTGFIARVGTEYEWIPGYLRIRGGGYWEPSRFKDPSNRSVPGRVHLTAGAEGRLFSFSLFGKRYRAALSVAFDVADRYGNMVISPGLWH